MIKQGLHPASFMTTCVACGEQYRPIYFYSERLVVGSSNHVCDPIKLKAREDDLRHQFDDDESFYCECDDIDCKFEYLEQLKLEMK